MTKAGALHLFLIQASRNPAVDAEPRLIEEGRFGCDYAWNTDYTAYRCLPHRWTPGSDASYAAYQSGAWNEDEDESEFGSSIVPLQPYDAGVHEDFDIPF